MSAILNNGPAYGPVADSDEGEISLGDLLGVIIENRWLIIGIMGAVFAIGVMYALIATPIYKADGLIQVEEKQSGLGDLDINALFEGDTSVNAEIEILRSRLVLGAVVDSLKLDVWAKPDHFPIIGSALARGSAVADRKSIRIETLDVPDDLIGESLTLIAKSDNRYELFGPNGNLLLKGAVGEPVNGQVAGEAIAVFVSDLRSESDGVFHLERQSRLKAIETLKQSLSISEKGNGSGILSLSLEGTSPKGVSDTLNEIANVYVRKNVERKSAEAEKTLAFLDEQLPSVKQDMEAAEVALNTYRLEKGSIDLPLETQAILETIVSAEGRLNELQQERDKVTQGFTPAHPMVIALDKQIQRLRGELDELNDQVRELPNTQQEVLRFVRDTQVNTELYTSLLNTAQELRVVKAGTVGNVRIVDYAVQPYTPVKPNRALVIMLSLVVGAFTGIAAAFVKRVLNGGIEDPNLIEKHVNIPVYANIAHSDRQSHIYQKVRSKRSERAVLAMDSPEDIAIESLRNLKTALHFGMMDVKNNCIMIAGASPSVGKSFVSANLAAVLSDDSKKVLLIDGDMRRGHLHQYLGLDREPGLSDFICGNVPIGDVLHQTTIEGLTLIPTGKIPPNPAELLLHKRFTNCMSVLTSRFDHIIIDSPPILAATDAAIIGQMAGATLLVLKGGQHSLREIEQSVKRLQQANVNLRGILINDISLRSRWYGAGRYSYQYSYGKD